MDRSPRATIRTSTRSKRSASALAAGLTSLPTTRAAPAARSISTSGAPTWPSPWTAIVLPSIVPRSRCSSAACIPTSTPRAVGIEGLPLPPSRSGMQVVKRVRAKTVAMSSTLVPTSSAVT